jgi:hypothetical protein
MSHAQPPPTWSTRIVLLAASFLAGVVLVAWWGASSLADRPGPDSLRVGDAVYTVTHVEQLNGLTDADVGGMTHGIQGLVTKNQMLIRVSLTVSAGDNAATFDATVLQVHAADGIGVAPLGGSLAGGRLRAHSRIDGSLSYVVPRTATARYQLRAGSNSRTSIPLLRGQTVQQR